MKLKSKKKTKKNKDLMRPSREHIDSPKEELLPTGENINDAYEKIGPSQEKVLYYLSIYCIHIYEGETIGDGSKEVIPPGSIEKGGSASIEKLSNEKASGSKEKIKEKEKEPGVR